MAATSSSIALALVLAVAAVATIGLVVRFLARNCPTNAEVARRAHAGEPISLRVPRARIVTRRTQRKSRRSRSF